MTIEPEMIGGIAGFLTTVCFIPQAVKAIRAEHTKSISLIMYLSFTIGVSLWLIYGIMLESMPMMLANGITLIFALIILVKKIHNLKKGVD